MASRVALEAHASDIASASDTGAGQPIDAASANPCNSVTGNANTTVASGPTTLARPK